MLDSLTPEARSLSLVPLRRGSIIAGSIISLDYLFTSNDRYRVKTQWLCPSTVEPAHKDMLRSCNLIRIVETFVGKPGIRIATL
jgi:hypothetical protein